MWKYIFNQPKPNKTSYEFKLLHSFEKRKAESDRIREKHPDKIPIIVERSGNPDLPQMEKKKFLVQSEVTVGQFLFNIRKKIGINSSQSLFLFVDNNITPGINSTLESIYKKHVDADGWLYITYCAENTFGY